MESTGARTVQVEDSSFSLAFALVNTHHPVAVWYEAPRTLVSRTVKKAVDFLSSISGKVKEGWTFSLDAPYASAPGEKFTPAVAQRWAAQEIAGDTMPYANLYMNALDYAKLSGIRDAFNLKSDKDALRAALRVYQTLCENEGMDKPFTMTNLVDTQAVDTRAYSIRGF